MRKNGEAVQLTTSVEFDPFAGAAISTSFPTTEPQKEVWLSSQLGADASCAYNESIILELRGNLNVALLEHALNRVVGRHDALRATVSPDGESLVISEKMDVPLPLEDWSLTDEAVRRADMHKLRNQEVTTPFDLLNGPLIRARVVKLSHERHDLIISAHHIICDGWSFEPLLSDLSSFYSAAVSGGDANLRPADSFQVYVTRHSDPDYIEEIAESSEYWLQRYRNVPTQTELPPDNVRPKERSFEAECMVWELPMSLVESAKSLSTSHRCSLMSTLLCAFEVYVSRLSGLTDIVVGVPSAGQLAFDCPQLVGHCVNLLPMRTHIETSMSFSEYLDSRRGQILTDFDHQKFTYGSLIKSLRLGRDPSRMPLSALMFNIDQPLEGVEFAGLECAIRNNQRKYEAFELFFNLTIDDDKAEIECQYNTNLYNRDLMEQRLESFQALLESIVAEPGSLIESVNMLSAGQRERAINGWAAGETLQVPAASFVEGFASTVSSSGDDTACDFGGRSLTYTELDALTDRVAATLAGFGVGPGHRVGIGLKRSENLLVSILAVQKSGAAYVPLDPEFPVERLDYIAADADLTLVISGPELRARLTDVQKLVDIDDLLGADAKFEPVPVSSLDPAYMIYTSGSTGKPKGVEISHGNLANFLYSMAKRPGMSSADRLLAVTSPSFDISILELLCPLVCGATVVIADDDSVIDGVRLAEILDTANISCMQATPSTWRMLVESGWEGNKNVRALVGGEAVDGDLADWLAKKCQQAWNMYGPTETTIWSTTKQLVDGERPVTIGTPIHNTRTYVLDALRNPVPPGASGELYIGGDGVARGYWRQDALTSERFTDNSFEAGRMYGTGDLVRHTVDGEIEFLGRLDNQVKLHGFRIELGDIEAALQRHESVAQAVAAIKVFGDNDDRLVAYVKPAATDIDRAALRAFVSDILPSYMVPNHIEALQEFPLTPNRKIDRRALPMPGSVAVSAVERDDSLSGATQEAVARIWAKVLGLPAVRRYDDFFELGGHSILVTRVISQIRSDLGCDLPFRRFFEAPILGDVADAVDAWKLLSAGVLRSSNAEEEFEEIEI